MGLLRQRGWLCTGPVAEDRSWNNFSFGLLDNFHSLARGGTAQGACAASICFFVHRSSKAFPGALGSVPLEIVEWRAARRRGRRCTAPSKVTLSDQDASCFGPHQ